MIRSKKGNLGDFLLFLPARENSILYYDIIRLMGFYAINLIIIIFSVINIFMVYQDGNYILLYMGILFVLLSLFSLSCFLIFRNLRVSQDLLTANLIIMMTMVALSAGGHYGLATLYFLSAFTVFYLVLEFKTGLFLPLYFFAAITLRLRFGSFNEDSIFFDPVVRARFPVVLGISAFFGLAGSVCLRLLLNYLSRLAFRDSITGLPNRIKIEEFLKSLCLEKTGRGKGFTLAAIRIQNLTQLNANLGTSDSDMILKLVTERLTAFSFPFAGSWSGPVFLSVLHETDKELLDPILGDLVKSLSAPYRINEKRVTAHFIITLSRFPKDTGGSHTLIENVLSLMEKKLIPGDIIYYDEESKRMEEERYRIINTLAHCDMDSEFSLVYQPKLKLMGPNCSGAEVLLRWDSKELGSIQPGFFIPLAEESGLIRNITRWVVNRAFEDIRKMRNSSPTQFESLVFAINLSIIDIKDPTFIQFLDNITEKYRIEPSQIEFEITESVQADNDPQIDRFLNFAKERGFSFAIDDFGTGYSNLSNLNKMKIHNLKIDKSLIDLIDSSDQNCSFPLVDAIISLGRSLNLEITGEGVETKTQENYLKRKKCTYTQGWYYSKPLSRLDFCEYIQKQD